MRIVILGKGGHAKVLADTVYARGNDCWQIDKEQEKDILPSDYLMVGIGDQKDRITLFYRYKRSRFITMTNPNSDVSPKARLGQGVYVGIYAMVGPSAKIGDNVLVNDGAQVQHDCVVGDHCVISPGAILCGGVTLGEKCYIGTSAIIEKGVSLEPDTFVPAETLVVGPTDFRKPVRMVQRHGAIAAAFGA